MVKIFVLFFIKFVSTEYIKSGLRAPAFCNWAFRNPISFSLALHSPRTPRDRPLFFSFMRCVKLSVRSAANPVSLFQKIIPAKIYCLNKGRKVAGYRNNGSTDLCEWVR